MKKLISLLLLGAILLTLLLAASAEEASNIPTELAQLLTLTDAAYVSPNDPNVSIPLMAGHDHVFWAQDSRHWVIMDAHGTRLFNETFSEFRELTNGLMALAKDKKYAIYSGTTCLTGYDYYNVTIEGQYIRAEKGDLSYDFFTKFGEKVTLPKLPSGWYAENLLGDNVIVAHQPSTQVYAKTRSLFDRQGNRLVKEMFSNYYFVDDAFLCTSYDEVYTADGQRATLDLSELRYRGPVCPGYYCLDDGGGTYYVMDKNLKIRTSYDLKKIPVADQYLYFFDEQYAVINRDGKVEVYDLDGKLLLTCDGECITDDVSSYYVATQPYHPEPWGLIVKNNAQYTYYNTELKMVLQRDMVQSMTTNCNYLVVTEKNDSQTYYDMNGKELFSCGAEGGYNIRSGAVVHQKDDLYAICGNDGQPITPYEYSQIGNANFYGLVFARKPSDDNWYYLNTAGEVVFSGESYSLEFPGSFDKANPSSLLVYRRGDKYGVIRYVAPGASPYVDVPENAWYHDAAFYCIDKGLFNGTAPDSFSPEDAMTRAMLVTVLWRYAGEVEEDTNPFTDVPENQWYTKAVAWAVKNGVVTGTSATTFSPDDNISREQMATILYRYAKSIGLGVSKQKPLTDFPDAGQVSSYATEALSWCVAEGIIGGSDGKLLPQGNATRAQVAAILMRFIENVKLT